MTDATSRALRIGELTVAGQSLFVTDTSFPVVVELDCESGEPRRRLTWPLSPRHRDRPPVNDLLVHDRYLWIAAPSAGGVVRFDLATGRHRTIDLEAEPGYLVPGDGEVWVVAIPDWEPEDADAPARGPADEPASPRPVVWLPPSPESVAMWEQFRASMSLGEDDSTAEEQDEDWVNDDDDSGENPLPRPIWRINGSQAVRVDVGGDVYGLAATSAGVVGVLRRPNDPLVKIKEPGGGSVSYHTPGVVVLLGQDTAHVIGEVEEVSGELVLDGDRCWMIGFAREGTPVRELDVRGRHIADAVTISIEEPTTVVGGFAVGIEVHRTTSFGGRPQSMSLRAVNLAAPDVDRAFDVPMVDPEVRAFDGTVWAKALNGSDVVAVDVDRGSVRTIPVAVDIADIAPGVLAPPGTDLVAHEQQALQGLRGAFEGGWRTESGKVLPFIRRIAFDRVELRGEFPATKVVAIFSAEHRPAVVFGRRWALYDELGNPQQLEYAEIHLMEDIEAAGWGLPPLEQCVPDSEGIVWF